MPFFWLVIVTSYYEARFSDSYPLLIPSMLTLLLRSVSLFRLLRASEGKQLHSSDVILYQSTIATPIASHFMMNNSVPKSLSAPTALRTLFSVSALTRCLGVLAVLALLWAAIYWAVSLP